MFKYKCAKCQGDQYSASENIENEACFYCGSKSVFLEEKAPAVRQDKAGANKNNHLNNTTNDKQIPDYIISHMTALMANLVSLEGVGLVDVYLQKREMRIDLEHFLATFTNYEVDEGYYERKYDRLRIERDGVMVYAMRRCPDVLLP